MPKSQLGFDVENNYEPKYITIRGKGDILAALRKSVKSQIKYILQRTLTAREKLFPGIYQKHWNWKKKDIHRITFNEITKTAVKESLKHPRAIDMDLVDAQQARRVLDRIVGYTISPLLWAKVKRGLKRRPCTVCHSTDHCRPRGRNRSLYTGRILDAGCRFYDSGRAKPLTARFYGTEKEKITIHSKEELDTITKKAGRCKVPGGGSEKRRTYQKAPVPFTTSTLQQEASKALNFSTQKTMRVAQQLYEGVDVKGSGTVGIITYLRTDSTRISDEADASASLCRRKLRKKEYVSAAVQEKKSGKKIQDAHEAIRPTDITRTPFALKESLTRDQFRLYQLIWKRFAASRMANAQYTTTSVKIDAAGYRFHVSASKKKFDGFMAVYVQDEEEKGEEIFS